MKIETNIHAINHLYKKGETIFHEGTPSSGIYCLDEGMVKVFKTEDDGREIILRLAGSGDFIGHTCISGSKLHINSAIAIEDTLCCFFEVNQFLSMLETNPVFMRNVLDKVENELGEAHYRSVNFIRKSVRERLAVYFISMATAYGEICDEGIRISIRLSREEIASYIGTAHETAIRFISEFKSLGLIREEQKYFYVLNSEEMEKLAGTR